MDDRNPYAPSSASLRSDRPTFQEGANVTAWRNLKLLVMLHGGELPARCIKCNAPADEPTKVRRVYWHPSGWYLLILINLIIYALIAFIVRKRALVAPGLCIEHKKRRRIFIAVAWTVFLLGAALGIMGFNGQGSAAAGGFGMLMILVSAIIAIVGTRTVVASKIDKDYVWLKGCSPEFLDSLPPLP